MHRYPYRIASRWAIALSLIALCNRAAAQTEDPLPAGWKVEKTITVAANELDQFSQRFGGRVQAIRNTYYSVNGRRLQKNVVTGASAADNRKGTSGPRY